jgi:gas vesicle protein
VPQPHSDEPLQQREPQFQHALFQPSHCPIIILRPASNRKAAFSSLYNTPSSVSKIIKSKHNNYNEDIKIKLIENFFQNKILIKKSKLLLSETLKDLKPEIYNEKNKKQESQEVLVQNFMNLTDNKKLSKYQNLIKIYNSIDSKEFNELLLFFLEGQCQSYFSDILSKHKNEYTEKCCEELLLKVSIEYLKKAIQYLYENKNNNDNNLLKLYAIAYLKTYCYYYVEINYHYFDKCNFEEINKILNDKDENNELIRNMRNIYIWRLYYLKKV